MNEKIMLVDLSKCTACRSCQVACKNWNGLPAVPTINRGTYQNPPDLNAQTYTLIRFQEIEAKDGAIKWLFRNDKCFHCTDAGCMKACPVPGCITRTESGAVVLDSTKCIGCKYCYHACPFSVPQFDAATEKMYKCHWCHDRQAEGRIPACAKACPTGTIQFGDKDAMITLAGKRVKELGGDASVYGEKHLDGTHVVYVLTEKPEVYEKLPVNPKISPFIFLWKDVLKPFSMLSFLGGLGACALYYLIKGPKRPKFDEGGEKHE
jgi:formate dehydrogenase iron-sulfur subunit